MITLEMIEAGARAMCEVDRLSPDAIVPNFSAFRGKPLWHTYAAKARAALEAAERAAWRPGSEPVPLFTIMLGPDGRRMIWCKTPHVPIYGWHWFDAPDPEDRDIEHPAFVRPLPSPPEAPSKKGED